MLAFLEAGDARDPRIDALVLRTRNDPAPLGAKPARHLTSKSLRGV